MNAKDLERYYLRLEEKVDKVYAGVGHVKLLVVLTAALIAVGFWLGHRF